MILEKHPKYFVLLQKDKPVKVTVDRLKPAFGFRKPISSDTLTDRLFKLANYPQNRFCARENTAADKKAATVADRNSPASRENDVAEDPPSRLSYRDALAPPTSSLPIITRSGRTSIPVSRYAP